MFVACFLMCCFISIRNNDTCLDSPKVVLLFNPRTVGGLTEPPSHGRGGGGTYVPPPANSKTTQRIDKQKKALDRS